MKRLLLGVVFSLMFASSAFAFPFLVCNEYAPAVNQPTYFLIDTGTTPISSPVQILPGGAVRLHHDLGQLPEGLHNWTVAACTVWGCSTAVPFGFTKAVPGAPTGLRLE